MFVSDVCGSKCCAWTLHITHFNVYTECYLILSFWYLLSIRCETLCLSQSTHIFLHIFLQLLNGSCEENILRSHWLLSQAWAFWVAFLGILMGSCYCRGFYSSQAHWHCCSIQRFKMLVDHTGIARYRSNKAQLKEVIPCHHQTDEKTKEILERSKI